MCPSCLNVTNACPLDVHARATYTGQFCRPIAQRSPEELRRLTG